MKKATKIFLSMIVFATLSWSTNITTWKTNYNSGSDIWIELEDKLNNTQDWVGIYPVGSDNAWNNVVDWRWAKDTSKTQVDQGNWYKFDLEDGKYEARFFLNNSFIVEDKVTFSVGEQQELIISIDNIDGYSIKNMRKLYVSNRGNDNYLGTKDKPFKSLKEALSIAKSNDIIYLREGKYDLNRLVINKSGTKDKPIIITPYNNEKVIFQGDDKNSASDFRIEGNWIILKDIEITDAFNGVRLTSGASHNRIINVISHHNKFSGFMIEDEASYNTFKNCDAHHMKNYGNGDGFGAGDRTDADNFLESEGKGNKFINCRAWDNIDDGFDFYGSAYPIEVTGCLAWKNGSTIDGNGFKFGPDNKQLKGKSKHLITNCMAWKNTINGFMYNDNMSQVTLKNNTSYDNHHIDILGANFRVLSSSTIKNNISILPRVESDLRQYENLNIASLSNKNSWGIIPEEDESIREEFISMDDSTITGKRNNDGTLPKNDFLKLKPNSKLKGMGRIK